MSLCPLARHCTGGSEVPRAQRQQGGQRRGVESHLTQAILLYAGPWSVEEDRPPGFPVTVGPAINRLLLVVPPGLVSCTFFLAANGLYSSSDDVIELTPSNFNQEVIQSGSLWLVEFYAPW